VSTVGGEGKGVDRRVSTVGDGGKGDDRRVSTVGGGGKGVERREECRQQVEEVKLMIEECRQ
jgi:hypothetical protein